MAAKTTPGGFPWQYVPRPGRIYGAATVGERGQIALPADARRDLGIEPGDKLMVFGNRLGGSLVLIKSDVFESFAEFITTKVNKLGDAAQAFMDSFTSVPTQPDETDQADDAEDGEAVDPSVIDAPSD